MLTTVATRADHRLAGRASERAPAPQARGRAEPSASADGDDEPATSLDRAMDRYAAGEDAAFDEVFRGLSPRLRAFLLRLSGSPELADDLAQETFLRMCNARGSFGAGRRVLPWAYAIARNCYVSQVRSTGARLARASVVLDAPESVGPASSTTGEDETIARQSARVVAEALGAMTPARREAFVLLRYEGLSVATAAQIVGVSPGALKIRAFHAYEALREALARMEDEARGDNCRPEPGNQRLARA
jgi:RNA polymerase sigma-70 factor, ECF subfamily